MTSLRPDGRRRERKAREELVSLGTKAEAIEIDSAKTKLQARLATLSMAPTTPRPEKAGKGVKPRIRLHYPYLLFYFILFFFLLFFIWQKVMKRGKEKK